MFGGQNAGGFNFTTPAASTTGTAPATGFSFGAPNTAGTTAPNPGGFSLGTAAGGTTGTSGGGFSFGASTGTAAGGMPGFSGFGAPAGSTTTAAAGGGAPAPGGFNFGMAAPKAAASTVGTTPGVPANTFGGLGASTAPTGFGGLGTSAAAAPTGFGGLGLSSTASTGFTGLGGGATNIGSVAAAAPTTKTAAGAGAGFSFGAAAPKATATATPSLSSLLAASSAPSNIASTASATTAAPTGFSLAGAGPASTATTGFSFGSSLGQPAAIATAKTTTTTASLGTGGVGGGLSLAGFGTSTASSSAATTSTTATSIASTLGGGGGQKQMTFRQLEDTINKWTTELEEQETCFLEQATQVNAWDRIVMENGGKIIQLNKDLERVKLDQQKLDHELDFVHSQQQELEELVSPLETALDQLPPISHTQHAHLEREHTYTLAESLDSQLKRMSQDLKEIVERLNITSNKPDDTDPLQQITKILNSHVVSLMWVDRNTANLQRRAEEIAKMMDLEKKEQERNFRMAYS